MHVFYFFKYLMDIEATAFAYVPLSFPLLGFALLSPPKRCLPGCNVRSHRGCSKPTFQNHGCLPDNHIAP